MRRRLVVLGVIACLGGAQAATANTEALNPCALLLSAVHNDPVWSDKVPVQNFEEISKGHSWRCTLVSQPSEGTQAYSRSLLFYFLVARSAALAHVNWKHVFDSATTAGQSPTPMRGFPVNEAFSTKTEDSSSGVFSAVCAVWWRKGRYWGNLGAGGTTPFSCFDIHNLFIHLMRHVPHR
jgi:hypothetical protein